jgi:hypothetical protein
MDVSVSESSCASFDFSAPTFLALIFQIALSSNNGERSILDTHYQCVVAYTN